MMELKVRKERTKLCEGRRFSYSNERETQTLRGYLNSAKKQA